MKVGLFENNMYLVAPHMMQFAVTGKPAAPMPNRISAWAIYDVFDTSDGGQAFIGVVTDTQWAAFCDEFGLPELKSHPELGSNRDRVLKRDMFMPIVREVFARYPRDKLLAICEEIGLPVAPINRPEDMFHDPHLLHPGAMHRIRLPGGGETSIPALPLEFDGERPPLRREAPKGASMAGRSRGKRG